MLHAKSSVVMTYFDSAAAGASDPPVCHVGCGSARLTYSSRCCRSSRSRSRSRSTPLLLHVHLGVGCMQSKAKTTKDDLMNRLNNALKQRDMAREEALSNGDKLAKVQDEIESGSFVPAAQLQEALAAAAAANAQARASRASGEVARPSGELPRTPPGQQLAQLREDADAGSITPVQDGGSQLPFSLESPALCRWNTCTAPRTLGRTALMYAWQARHAVVGS